MTQPVATGSDPAAWGLPGPVSPDRQVPVHGAPGRDLFYVRSPVTGDVRGVSELEAQELIFRSGWEPVVEPDAVRLLENQILRERANPYQALLYGTARGVTGGLAEFLLPQGEDPGARALDAIREEYPGTVFGSEVAGALLPLSRALGAARYASPVALAEAAGEGITRAAAGAAPGVGRSMLARAGGTAVEGGLIGSMYEAGQSRIEDSPLTAQKIAGGFLAGALPGAVIGAPLGAVEGLGGRYARRSARLQGEVLTPGVSDADLMKIAHREHGVAVPGMIEDLQAAIQRDPNLSPDFFQLAKDRGAVGAAVRGQLVDAPAQRFAAEQRAAAGLNAIQELDDRAIEGWIHGKPKRELIQEWLESGPAEVDIDAVIAQARQADSPGEVPLADRPTRVDPEAGIPTLRPQTLGSFAKNHPQYQELLAFLNEERRAAGRYERYRTRGIQELGIEGDRADRVRQIANTMVGAQRVLDDAASAGLAERRVLYRGAKLQQEDLEAVLGKPDYQNPAIWSMAETSDAAESFAKKKLRPGEVPVLFEIDARGAVKADGIPGSETFEEYLLPRARNMRIVSREVRDDGVNVIRLRELEPERPTVAAPQPEIPARAPVINDLARAIKRSADADRKLEEQLLIQLGTTEDKLEETIALGLASRDENVSAILSNAIKNASSKSKEVFSVNAYNLVGKNPEVLQWRARAGRLVDALGDESDGLMVLSPGVLGQPRAEARKVRDLIANARMRIATGDRAEAFAALDELKGRLGPHAKPDAWLGGDDNVARFVRNAYEEIRQTLEDSSLWGERAAAAQREMNAIFHRRMARADGYFKQFFDDAGVPHPRNPWVNARKATPEKVRGALKGIVNPDESEALGLFRGHVAETRELADKMRRYYNLTPEAEGNVERLLRGVDEAERGLDDAVLFARREAQADSLFANKANVVPGYAKWIALGFLGPAGFAAVKVAENIANPGQRIFQRAVLERILRGSESRIAKAVLKLTTGKAPKFRGVGATQLAARASTSLLHEPDPQKRAESYASTLAELTKLSTPEAGAQAAAKAMPFAVGTLPQAPSYLGHMLSRAAQYVLAQAPVKPMLTARGVEVITPSDSELDEFERIYAGAFDPLSAVEDAADGEGSLAAMKAAEFVAPELVQEARMLVIENLQGKQVPHNRVVDISIVLGVPLDATLEPEYINMQQVMHAARFKDSEAQKSRRTFEETGVNEEYKPGVQSGADRVESDVPPE